MNYPKYSSMKTNNNTMCNVTNSVLQFLKECRTHLSPSAKKLMINVLTGIEARQGYRDFRKITTDKYIQKNLRDFFIHSLILGPENGGRIFWYYYYTDEDMLINARWLLKQHQEYIKENPKLIQGWHRKYTIADQHLEIMLVSLMENDIYKNAPGHEYGLLYL